MKILVISLAGIGDTLFATPLIHELRANFKEAKIEALVMWAGARDLLEGNTFLDSIFQQNLIRASKWASLAFLWRLRRQRYDVSINTHPQSRIPYRLVARIINAKTRVSHLYDNSGAMDKLLVNRSIPQDYAVHSTENNLALLGLLGAGPRLRSHDYEITLASAERDWAKGYVQSQKLAGRPILGVHIGSGGTKNLALRRWPLSNYLALIKRLIGLRPDLAVLLFGGPEEEKERSQILAETGKNSVFSPKTTNLRQAAALLAHCGAFLSVDTLFMHLAAAMKVPNQFVIETPTWNKPIQPYGNPFVLIENPAVSGRNLQFYRYDGRGIRGSRLELSQCMEAVTVDSVYSKMQGALK